MCQVISPRGQRGDGMVAQHVEAARYSNQQLPFSSTYPPHKGTHKKLKSVEHSTLGLTPYPDCLGRDNPRVVG